MTAEFTPVVRSLVVALRSVSPEVVRGELRLACDAVIEPPWQQATWTGRGGTGSTALRWWCGPPRTD